MVVAPETMVAPAGTVQVYPVAPGMTCTEYTTPVCPWQTGVVPVMTPAALGRVLTVITKGSDTKPFPQEFVPYTEILPPGAPSAKSTVISFVLVGPMMVAPVGTSHT